MLYLLFFFFDFLLFVFFSVFENALSVSYVRMLEMRVRIESSDSRVQSGERQADMRSDERRLKRRYDVLPLLFYNHLISGCLICSRQWLCKWMYRRYPRTVEINPARPGATVEVTGGGDQK